jgi:C-terminal processing protease CtpA/Prc
MFGSIAQAVSELNDSHTFFYPPAQTIEADYGWELLMVGTRCFVVAVKPGSGAETQGLKPGDEVLQVDLFTLSRQNLWRFRYLYYALAPQPGMRVTARGPDGQRKVLNIPAKVEQKKLLTNLRDPQEYYDYVRDRQNNAKLGASRYYENINDVFVWQMPSFTITTERVDEIMGKARKHKALVLDLRGNPGGFVTTFLRMVGYFFDKDITVGERHDRKKTEPMIAKSRGRERVFTGQLVVLVDSGSASAAELFARVIQTEKRGTVIGDISSGAVMVSQHRSHQLGVETAIFFGMSVTESDIVMPDGKSLEGVGVTPDKLLLPTATDIAAQRDPVLAYAASLVGVELSPEKAATLFPWQWRK